MRTKNMLFAFLLLTIVQIKAQEIYDFAEIDNNKNDLEYPLILKTSANKELDFNYPYLLYLPKSGEKNIEKRLLVEPNNTGVASDDFEYHELKAIDLIKKRYPREIADGIDSPLLIPIFPRPQSMLNTYTHALDKDVMNIEIGNKLYRIDLQLLAMIADAKMKLKSLKFKIKQRVFMNGFSASGNFVNRFAALHPNVVRAVASGGVNGLPILPVKRLTDKELPFPIGISDLESYNIEFNSEAYNKVSQFIYMGAFDRNDTYPYSDAWNDNERKIIAQQVAFKMMPDRWDKSKKVISSLNLPIQFATYNGIGHTITPEIKNDIINFFLANKDSEHNEIEPFQYPYMVYREIVSATINKIYWHGDDSLPDNFKSLNGGDFALNIKEYYINQDYNQLNELINNAGFSFRILTNNENIEIDMSNYRGTISSGDGKIQAFCIKLRETDLDKMKIEKDYILKPLDNKTKYSWKVTKDLVISKPQDFNGKD